MEKNLSENIKMFKYAAFLRGINVGGNNLIKMEELKKVFESMGFRNVKTILASGNVIFESMEVKAPVIIQTIGEKLESAFGYNNGVIIRSIEQIRKIAIQEPFKQIKVTPQTRLYVTFLQEKSKSSLKIPYESPNKGYKIISNSEYEVFSVATLSPEVQSTDLMNILDKEFGRKVTTRNWNTIEKILKN
jgi:uncharacterized protein (DUF1697 family)